MASLLATHRCAVTPARFAAAIAMVALASGGYLIARAPADAALALAPVSVGAADVIISVGSQATLAVRRATSSIPIVMHGVSHAAESGFVTSLARPGGNVTGLTNQLNDLQAKHLELLLAIVPDFRRVGVLWSPSNSGSALAFKDMQASAAKRSLVLHSFPVESPAALAGALAQAESEKIQAMHVHPTPAIASGYLQIVEWAMKRRVATISGLDGFTRAGFLLSYSALIGLSGFASIPDGRACTAILASPP